MAVGRARASVGCQVEAAEFMQDEILRRAGEVALRRDGERRLLGGLRRSDRRGCRSGSAGGEQKGKYNNGEKRFHGSRMTIPFFRNSPESDKSKGDIFKRFRSE